VRLFVRRSSCIPACLLDLSYNATSHQQLGNQEEEMATRIPGSMLSGPHAQCRVFFSLKEQGLIRAHNPPGWTVINVEMP
jgi:hypothetical protein